MQTVINSPLLNKMANLTTGMVQLRHAVDFALTSNGPRLEFLCRASSTDACRIYPDCSCDNERNKHLHPAIEQKRCWLNEWFTDLEDGAIYDGGADHAVCPRGSNWRLPPVDRAGFIKTRVVNHVVYWSWFELSDLLDTTSCD